jgi:hypothetical protein
MTLVEFVEDHTGHALERRVAQEAAREDAFGEEAQTRTRSDDFFEADLVADGATDRFAALGRDEPGGESRGQAAGLEYEHFARIEIEQGGWDARSLPCPGRSFDYQGGSGAEMSEDVGDEGVDGERHCRIPAIWRRMVSACG